MPALPSRRRLLLGGAALTGLAAAPALRAQAPVKIAYGYSAVTDYANVFVAIDEGFFARRGLEVDAKFIPINPTIVPALQSGSLQIGGVTPTGFLQASEGGLDHVVLGGGGVLSKRYTEVGLVARAGSGIRSAQDCVGRKIGVPGLGALLHVTFRQWLKMNKVDQARVSFVEAAFPQQADLMRGGTVDAVVTAGPFMARMVGSGAGYVASYYTTFMPEGFHTIVHTARRDWALQNPAAVKAFAEGIHEATAFMGQPKNEAAVRASIGKYLKLPPPVVAAMQISPALAEVSPKHLQWWATLMREQSLIRQVPNLNALIVKA